MRWSNNLAYVIGLITTDGNLSKDGRHINLTSKDLEQIYNFKKVLNLKNKISLKKSSYTGLKKYYFLQFGNIRLYRFLLSIGIMPNKTKILADLIIPKKYFADYLRGFLDGDGYTNSYWDKRWKKSFCLYTGFTSASLAHLQWIKEKIVLYFRIKGAIKFSGKSTYHLIYAKNSSIKLLREMYYNANVICLSRKRYKIEEALGIIQKQAGVAKLVDAYA